MYCLLFGGVDVRDGSGEHGRQMQHVGAVHGRHLASLQRHKSRVRQRGEVNVRVRRGLRDKHIA